MLKDCFQLLLKNKIIVLLYLLLFLGINAYMFDNFTKWIIIFEDDFTFYDGVENSLRAGYFSFFFFTVLAYEYFKKWKKEGLYEINRMLSEKRVFGCQFTVLLALVLLYFLNMLVWNIVCYRVYGIHDKTVLGIIVSNVVLYGLLVNLLGVLVGYVMTLIPSEKFAVLAILFVFILVSPIMSMIADSVSTVEFNAYSFIKWFYILPQGLNNSPNHYCPFFRTAADFFIVLFWCVICLCFCNVHFYGRAIRKISTIVIMVCIAGFCAYEAGYITSGDAVWYDFEHFTGSHCLYYEDAPVKEKQVDYSVEKYDLDINVKHKMKAKVQVTLTKEAEGEYCFTLYHQYRLRRIENAEGKSLDFKRETDYVTIYPKGDMKSLTFWYEGDAGGFYSSDDGMNLPGYFCYYPIPGFYQVYDYDAREFLLHNMEKAQYHLTVNQEVFCNLKQIGKYEYEGKTDGLEIVKGVLKELNYRGVRVIYPYTGFQNVYAEEHMKENVDKLLELEQAGDYAYTLVGKTVFSSAPINSDRYYTYGSDWAAVNSFGYVSKDMLAIYQYYLQNEENVSNSYYWDEIDVDEEGYDE